MWRFTIVVALGALLCQAASAQTRRPNLVERARAHGNIEVTALACGFFGRAPTLNGLIQGADIILHGNVVAADGRLSRDRYEVWTDYQFEAFDVLRSLSPQAEAGVLRVAVRGGVVVVEGREIVYNYSQTGQRLSMGVGQEVVVFGALRDEGERFHATAVFPVVDGRATSNGKLNGFDAVAGVPVEQFVQSIRQIAAQPRP